jgi:cation diffusion facilitator CzcD-associated flavoprotein CzcO
MNSTPQASAQPMEIGQPDFEVAVLGSGFSGPGMAIKLKQADMHAFVVLGKAQQIGGTWRENTYPGCACDVPSHMYSFSFERKPDWSRMYSRQPETFAYLTDYVEKHGLMPYVRFGAEVREAVFDETNHLWTVGTAGGQSFTARVIVSAMGALHLPAYPTRCRCGNRCNRGSEGARHHYQHRRRASG